MWTDLRSALRALRASPWTSLAAAAILALGVGAGTAVFAVADGVLLSRLPYADPDRLAVISLVRRQDGADLGAPLDRVGEWRDRLQTTTGLAGYAVGEFTIRDAGEPMTARVGIVERGFFALLGAPPAAGRWPSASGTAGEAAVSIALARRLESNGGTAAGRGLSIGARPFVVTGVAGDGFAFPADDLDAWAPADVLPDLQVFGRPNARSFRMLARLRDGVSIAQAREDVARVVRELYPAANMVEGLLIPVPESLVGDARPVVMAFAGAAALLLLVACANAATLVIGRAMAREREFAVRLALGAGRARLARTAMLEGAVLGVAAAGGGLVMAQAVLAAFREAIASQVPRAAGIHVSGRTVAVAIGVAALVAIVCGVAPAAGLGRLRSLAALRGGASTVPRAGRRVRDVLIVAQVAMAAVLLVGAGLLGRTVWSLLATDIGVERDHALVARLSLTETTRFDAASRGQFVEALLQRVRAIPGVTAAGLGSNLPPRQNQLEFTVRVVNEEQGRDESIGLSLVSATPGFFEALGIPVRRGRGFEDRDLDGDPFVAVMTEHFLERLSPNRDLLDQTLPMPLPRAGGRERPRLVGIVPDVRYRGLERPALGAIYLPWTALPTGVSHLVVRTAGPPLAIAPAVTRTIRELDPSLPVPVIRTLADEVSRAVEVRTLRLALVAGFAMLAFAVAAAGLGGALFRDVVERRRELAIRGALGLTPRGLVRLVVAGGTLRAMLGLLVGFALALAAGRAIASLLFGVTAYDPLTYAAVFAAVMLVALAASLLPARRASRIDPVETLRV